MIKRLVKTKDIDLIIICNVKSKMIIKMRKSGFIR